MSCDASCEHADAGDVSEGGRAFDGFLPVLCEAAAASEPCECPLDHPAARQDDEALGRVGALDDLDGPAAVAAHGVLEFVACIAAVGEDVAQPWMAEPDRPEQVGSAVAILTSARWTRTKIRKPSVSVMMWRLRPLIFLPASYPQTPPLSVVLTLWLSMMPAVGWACLPSISRAPRSPEAG